MTEALNTIVDYSTDISSAEAPPALPAGLYPAEIKAAQVKTSENTGNKYYDVAFHIPAESFPADFPADVAPDGLTLNYRRLSAEDTVQGKFRVRGFCESLGAPMSNRIDVNDWVGRNATVELTQSEWEGVIRNEIKKVQAAQ